ncbi:MAG: phage tail sheath subtilisin-like domain-containing protein [Bacteroidetes bacterium]|nr:phage tail sheath subtilisin-like domain-containing protein [Bacteroidota bacterium]
MNLATIKTPGVYINEVNAFPNGVVAVATAVPAFIGYTPRADYQGVSYTNVPQRITSFSDFQAFYCLPDPPAPAPPAKQFNPQYYLVKQPGLPAKGDYVQINGAFYSILPDPNTVYYLYNAVKMFYENGGGDAYIVSVGGYGAPSGKPGNPGDPLVNANVQLADLQAGLGLLLNEQEPTMYICPDATLLTSDNNASLMKAMLLQNSIMGTAVSIFDIIGGNAPDPLLWTKDIDTFRANTGNTGLNYGTAYYPFVRSTVVQNTDIDYTNFFGGDITQLTPIINPPASADPSVTAIIANIQNPASGLTVQQNNTALVNASTPYSLIVRRTISNANMMPPSGAMAGVITATDNAIGPWQAPANIGFTDVSNLPINLSATQQGYLNVDAVTGKSINAIRSFNGLGILVWGARTLDGNSLDWKYLSVRRTVIFLEQSCKLAANAYVFQPNTKNTWESVKSMISSFLNSIWKLGGLMGASPADAYSVDCGLGTTMTAEDILLGFMNVTVKVAVTRPAEFIVITFQQQMPTSS